MKVVGIIAEYNPFHNGHLYHLQETKKMINPDVTLCVMSGNFTQRGEPAMADKWIRAASAVKSGIDLVLELPFAFACNNAEYFAYGAVDILNRLGCVTHLSFGSEAGDLESLLKAAEYLSFEDDLLKGGIKEFADQGISFPKARYEAVKKYAGDDHAAVLKSANNILGVEYLKQLCLTKSQITPVTVKRYGTGYHDMTVSENIASASFIRNQLAQSGKISQLIELIPRESYEVLNGIDSSVNIKFNDFYQLMVYKILTSEPELLGRVLSATEGLENRMKKAAAGSKDMDTLIKAVLSKRYTATRIQRLLTHTLIPLEKDRFRHIMDNRINYARVLAFNRKGASLIKQIKKEERNTIPLLTNINREITKDAAEWKLLQLDITASDVYNLTAYNEIYRHSDYVRKPFKDFD